MADASEPQPPGFDDGWSTQDRMRSPTWRRSGAQAGRRDIPRPNAGASMRSADQQTVTVLKSGIGRWNGPNSLYSDGSIEAQMPEGLMRFASIDELRAHLDQRPG